MARVIKYDALKGIVSERRISVADLQGAGVAKADLPREDLVWSSRNAFLLNVDNLSDHVIGVVLQEPGLTELKPKQADKVVEQTDPPKAG